MTDQEWLWDRCSKGEAEVITDPTFWYDKDGVKFYPKFRLTYKDTAISGCKTLADAIAHARKLD